jgi:hypothetical protein
MADMKALIAMMEKMDAKLTEQSAKITKLLEALESR